MATQLDLDTLIDSSRVGSFQRVVIALCAIMVMIDGFDTQVIGMVAPAMATSWHIAPPAFGIVFATGLFGGLIGVLALGTAADQLGRKRVLIGAILLFAGVSLLTPLTTSLPALVAVRFVAGLGMGGALPGLIAVTSEYLPKASRTNVTALMYCGFPLGSVLAGIVSAQMLPRFGWPSVFYVGSIIPLALLPLFAWWVPESAHFLAARGEREPVERILARIGCAGRWNGRLGHAPEVHRSPVAGLFAQGRAIGTVLLWVTLFLSLLLTVFLVSWLPLVAHTAGIDIKQSVLAVSALNIGGIIGCYAIGKLCKRYGAVKPIALGYGLGSVGIALLGYTGHSGTGLLVTAFAAGTFTVGAQMCAIGMAASFYDTALRSTGVGWSLGFGRLGAVVGPALGGVLIAAGLSTQSLFLVAGLVSLGAALSVLTMSGAVRRVVPDIAVLPPSP
jgi:AAHS family 4-hydroxybenzoate transporter-like MFS transporter